jgi:c-di-GMP-binding flagellar brake protein YcgR
MSVMVGGAEKRQHHRFLARLEIRVVSGDHLPPNLQVQTVDVAVGGARILATGALLEKSRLHISLTLVGGSLHAPESILIDALVLRTSQRSEPHHGFPFEAALQFVRIDPHERRKLQSYLNSL